MRNLILIFFVVLVGVSIMFSFLTRQGSDGSYEDDSVEFETTNSGPDSSPSADVSSQDPKVERMARSSSPDVGEGDEDESRESEFSDDDQDAEEHVKTEYWHSDAHAEVEAMVHDNLGDRAYLQGFHCDGPDCRGQVFFAGENSYEVAANLQSLVNESGTSVGESATRPLLINRVGPGIDGVEVDFVIKSGHEIPDPDPDHVIEALNQFLKDRDEAGN